MRERLTASTEAARTAPLAGPGRKWGRGADGGRGDVFGDSMGSKVRATLSPQPAATASEER